MHRKAPVLLMAWLLAGCDLRAPVEPDVREDHASLRSTELEFESHSQVDSDPVVWHTPWLDMTDDELAEAVSTADGRVFVGFKEAEAIGGVDAAGRIVVPRATLQEGKDYLASLGLSLEREYELVPAVVTTIAPDLVGTLRANPLIEYVEPILPGRFLQDTTWNMEAVRAPEAWPSGDGSGVKLLIIDSGLDGSHADLDPTVVHTCYGWHGNDNHGHGTGVAGVAAALDNTIDVIGVSHGVSLLSVKVGDGWNSISPADVVCGVEFGRNSDVFVMNLSLGFQNPSTPLTQQIVGAWSEGRMIVAAAGNNNGDPVEYPASLSPVIAVTATDANDNRWFGAARGPELELSAPGVDVPTTKVGVGTVTRTGTSFAAPHVAAAAALLKSHEPFWSTGHIRQRMRETAKPLGSHNQFGYGRLDIRAALDWDPPDYPPASPQNFQITHTTAGCPSAGHVLVSWSNGGWLDTIVLERFEGMGGSGPFPVASGHGGQQFSDTGAPVDDFIFYRIRFSGSTEWNYSDPIFTSCTW